jgi:hypothetical protein
MYQTPLILSSDDPGYFPSLQLHSQDIALRISYEEMRRDCHVLSTLNKLNNTIAGRQVLVDPIGDSDKDKASAEIAKKILSKINYSKVCTALLDAHYIGVAFLCVKEWVNEDSVLYPEFVSIPWWRFIFEPINKNSKQEIPIYKSDRPIKKNAKIATHMGYEIRILTKRRPVTGERLLEGDVIVYSFGSSYYPYGLGLAWRFYPWWITKNAARDNIIRQTGRVGSPPIIGENPPDVAENDPRFLKWCSFLKLVSPNGYFTGPPGYKAENLFPQEITNTSEFLISLAAQEISKAALSEVPLSATDHGSYNAQVSQNDDRESNVIDAHCILLNDCLARTIWKKIKEYNYPGSNSPDVRIWTTNEDIKKEITKTKKEEERAEEDNKKAQEKHKIELLKMKSDWWNVMINQLGLTPEPELIEKTFGKGWSLPKQETILDQFGGEVENVASSEQIEAPQEQQIEDIATTESEADAENIDPSAKLTI